MSSSAGTPGTPGTPDRAPRTAGARRTDGAPVGRARVLQHSVDDRVLLAGELYRRVAGTAAGHRAVLAALVWIAGKAREPLRCRRRRAVAPADAPAAGTACGQRAACATAASSRARLAGGACGATGAARRRHSARTTVAGPVLAAAERA